MELKKNILHSINQCWVFTRKNQQTAQQAMQKLDNMKIHIDFCASELIDQVCYSFRFNPLFYAKSF
jgi:hypothetical protein